MTPDSAPTDSSVLRDEPVTPSQVGYSPAMTAGTMIVGGGVGVILGISFSHAYAIAVVAGLFIAFLLNLIVIAPIAGKHAKQRLMYAFADPSPEDELIIQAAGVRMVQTMGAMAQTEKGQLVLNPLFDYAQHRIVMKSEMAFKNLSSQMSQGRGIFNPANIASDKEMAQEVVGSILGNVVGPIAEGLGLGDNQREALTSWALLKIMGGGGNGGQQALPAAQGVAYIDYRSP